MQLQSQIQAKQAGQGSRGSTDIFSCTRILDPYWTCNSRQHFSVHTWHSKGFSKCFIEVMYYLHFCPSEQSSSLPTAGGISVFLPRRAPRAHPALAGCSHGLTGFHLFQTASRGWEGEAGSSALLARTARACTPRHRRAACPARAGREPRCCSSSGVLPMGHYTISSQTDEAD